MRAAKSDPPRWLTAVLTGVPFGVALGLWVKLDGGSWLGAGFIALSGIPFGLCMASWSANWKHDLDAAEGDLPPAQLQEARRAATRGPVPADPAVRKAAIRIAAAQLPPVRQRRLMVLAGGVMVVCAAGAAADGSLWALSYGLSAVVMLYSHGYWPRQIHQRVRQLTSDPAAK